VVRINSFTYLLSLLLLLVSASRADNGFIDLNVYPYTEEKADTAVTVNVLANLPARFQYYSLNSFGRVASLQEYERLDTVVSEQNLRWQLPGEHWDLFQLTAQALLRDESDNDVLRFGIRWRAHDTPVITRFFDLLNLGYWLNVHAIQLDETDGRQWQISHFFRFQIFPETFGGRVYLKGWTDHNLDHENGTDHTWVEEAQLGIRIYDEFYAIAEQRYNGFRKGNEASVALGVEYLFRF